MIRLIKYSYTVFLLSFFIENANGQSAKQPNKKLVNRLIKGDKVPDVSFTISNYKSTTVKISDFKGKLLILDFWGVYCVPCVASIPKMEALQKKFGDKIQIILVTKNTIKEVKQLMEKSVIVNNLTLPSVIGDSLLPRLFPYKTVPTHAWVNEKGIVEEITDGYNTTEKNIEAYLNGRKQNFIQKNELLDFNPSVPLWREGNGRQIDKFIYHSLLMKYDKSFGGSRIGPLFDSATAKTIGVRAINISIAGLFQYACIKWDNRELQSLKRIIYELPDKGRLIIPKDLAEYDKWCVENLYSYELKVPISKSETFFDFMKRNLQDYFGISGAIEQRKVKCLLLQKTDSSSTFQSKGGKPLLELAYDKRKLVLRNQRMQSFINYLEMTDTLSSYPIINNTGYNGYIDITINCLLSDRSALNAELRKYSLELIESEQEIDMLVLKGLNVN
jgi:thiol-disulfide isomerase/thioredoxin